MTDLTQWRGLCAALCPDDPSLGDEVLLCIEQPEAYLKRFEDDLAQRCIEDCSELTPWLALVDGLESRGFLREFDYKTFAQEVSGELESLRQCQGVELDFTDFDQSDAADEELLQEAANSLAQAGLVLLFFDINGDCYPLMPVPRARVDAILAACERVGHAQDLILYQGAGVEGQGLEPSPKPAHSSPRWLARLKALCGLRRTH